MAAVRGLACLAPCGQAQLLSLYFVQDIARLFIANKPRKEGGEVADMQESASQGARQATFNGVKNMAHQA